MKVDLNATYEAWKADTNLLDTLLKETEQYATRISMTRLAKADVEDAVQETLLSVCHGLPDFRGESSFLTWVHSIVVQKCNMALRKLERRAEVGFNWEIPFEEALDAKLDLIALLDKLDREEHRLLRLVAEGETYEEIGRELNLQPAAVRMRWSRLKERLANATLV